MNRFLVPHALLSAISIPTGNEQNIVARAGATVAYSGMSATDRCAQLDLLLNASVLRRKAADWLAEDASGLDVGAAVVGSKAARAELRCKQTSVFAGRPFFDAIFAEVNCQVEWLCGEGEWLNAPVVAAVVTGPAHAILRAERTALNVITRTCGVATVTRQCVEAARALGSSARVAATRKTTPGFRLAEKYAVVVGGGDTHRYDLSSMVMLKDNHVDLRRKLGQNDSLRMIVSEAKQLAGFSQKIEVESRTFEEAVEAAESGADIVMLDNFDAIEAKRTAKKVKEVKAGIIVEVSGGITIESMKNYLDNEGLIDVVSMSALTQGYNCADYSLKIVSH